MTFMIHRGGEVVEADQLASLPTPEPTKSHHPIAHKDVVAMVKYSLGFFEHEIVREDHAIDKDGARYFGLLTLHSRDLDYSHTVGLRNSHDKTFPIGISFGSRVFVCDNLSFAGDHVIRRRHTPNAKRDLPGLVAEVIEPLHDRRQAMSALYDRFQAQPLGDYQADAMIMAMYKAGVINVQRIAHVLDAWEHPQYDWGDKTAWRLFNAVTFALNGMVAENPTATTKLHDIIEGTCVHN